MEWLVALVIVIVVAALLCWLVYYIPFPPGAPAWVKNVIYVLILLVAVLVIAYRIGGMHAF